MSALLYKSIAERAAGDCHLVATVMEGQHAGEKLFLSDGAVSACTAGTDEDDTSSLLPPYAKELGKIMQTTVLKLGGERIFCERLADVRTMVICGGGHVSIPIIQMGKSIGFWVVVLEDRPKYADCARRAGADEVYCDTFEAAMAQIAGSADTYFVIVTRGHRYDAVCLRAALAKPSAYIGMMGSKKRVAMLKSVLKEEGVQPERLKEVHAPIGLDIGAETPEEIAVSILAEIICTKNSKGSRMGYDDAIMQYLTGEKEPEKKKALATIVSKKGSAPRAVGTKMLILEDGTTVGTIGGGCMESEVIGQGLLLLREDSAKQKVVFADMTGADAEENGMVCGGMVEVYLERV